MKTLLRLENISASYGKKQVLSNVQFDLGASEIVALIGANGSGKSTLLKVVSGLLKPYSGTIRFQEHDITTWPSYRRIRWGISCLVQKDNVFQNLTVRENLEMGLLHIPASQRTDCLSHLVDLFPDLGKKWSCSAALLSGGQRKALAVGMVLIQNPKVMLLDEPATGLSSHLANKLFETLGQLVKQNSMAVILTEQKIKEALSVANRAICLQQGSIYCTTDQPDQWLNEETVSELFMLKGSRP